MVFEILEKEKKKKKEKKVVLAALKLQTSLL